MAFDSELVSYALAYAVRMDDYVALLSSRDTSVDASGSSRH
jgi:hypothetical protein